MVSSKRPQGPHGFIVVVVIAVGYLPSSDFRQGARPRKRYSGDFNRMQLNEIVYKAGSAPTVRNEGDHLSTATLALAARRRWHDWHGRLFAIIADHSYRDPTPFQVRQGLLGVRDVAKVIELNLVCVTQGEQDQLQA